MKSLITIKLETESKKEAIEILAQIGILVINNDEKIKGYEIEHKIEAEGLEKVEKPILFNTEMVKAILEGRKTQTRRIVKPQPKNYIVSCHYSSTGFAGTDTEGRCRCSSEEYKPPYNIGDILWVRETWSPVWVIPKRYLYRASPEDVPENTPIKWHPSIHMPRKAARIFLKVTDVRVERLQDITDKDAKAEGIKYPVVDSFNNILDNGYRLAFSDIWNKLYKNWEENPWVWVVEFERVKEVK